MIPVKQILDGQTVVRATVFLFISLVIATASTVWLVAEIRKEQRAVQEILLSGTQLAVESLGTLPGELRWQFAITILVSLVLMSAAIGLVTVARAYVSSEASLTEVRALSAHILASMNQGVITTDVEGNITSMNARVRELLHLPEGVLGRPLAEICREPVEVSQICAAVWERKTGTIDRDFSFGHTMRLRAEGQILRDDDQEPLGVALLVRDVTERTLMEERLRRMERFMGLGTLIAGLHHEIKNPLNALSLHVQLLEERLARTMDQEIAEDLAVMKAEVHRIVGVLETFGDYASVEKLNITPTDVVSLVRHAERVVRPKAEQQNVTIMIRLEKDPVPAVQADGARLEQVLLNLIFNALDEMALGGTLTITVDADDKDLFLWVADTGKGIPDNIRSRIFDPYFTTKRRGLGMGLALCDKVVREHHGQIDVQTSPQGTQFRLTLPLWNGTN